ncbi:MAG: MOSC domain-containing protein [Pseudomonadota bacterium]
MNPTGTLAGIARKAAPKAIVEPLEQISVSVERGLEGDFRGKHRKRKVTVMRLEDGHAACREINRPDLPWTTRRANLLVTGMTLPHHAGDYIHIGDVILQITGETEPCQRMEQAAAGLEAALRPDWRGGVTCLVVRGGEIALDDPVSLAAAP